MTHQLTNSVNRPSKKTKHLKQNKLIIYNTKFKISNFMLKNPLNTAKSKQIYHTNSRVYFRNVS